MPDSSLIPAADLLPFLVPQIGRVQARAGGGTAELILFGDVGGDITARGVVEALRQVDKAARLTIRINSPGGALVEAFAIYNALKRHTAHKTVVVEGVAASAASLIAMAGDEIVMPANAFMMLHHPRALAAGPADEMRAAADMLDRLSASCIAIYAQRSGQTEEKVRELMDAETWLDAQEAVALGFADRVEAAIEAAAHFDLSRFLNTPQQLAMAPAMAAAPPAGHSPIRETTMATTSATDAPRPIASVVELRSIAMRSGLTDTDVLDIASNRPQGEWRDAVIDMMASRDVQRPAIPLATNPGATYDNPAFALDAMGDALAARMSGGTPKAPARAFMHMSLPDMAKHLLDKAGARTTGMSRSQIVDAAMSGAPGLHTTTDFPTLLRDGGRRVLAQSYEVATSPIRSALCGVRDVPDFRETTTVRLGEFPKLEKIAEHGAVKFGSATEVKQGYRLETYGKSFGLTREAIVNDDLTAFGNVARWSGSAAAETEAQILVDLLTANSGAGPTMSDGKALFHADHGNLAGTGAAIDYGTLSAARTALRRTKGIDGTTSISVPARYMLVAPENETNAEKLLLAAYIPSGGGDVQVNPMAGKLELLVEPRLTAAPWYLFADPALGPVLEVSYLQGTGRAPQLKTFEGQDYLGVWFRVVHDFGAGVIGWRGAYRNAGA